MVQAVPNQAVLPPAAKGSSVGQVGDSQADLAAELQVEPVAELQVEPVAELQVEPVAELPVERSPESSIWMIHFLGRDLEELCQSFPGYKVERLVAEVEVEVHRRRRTSMTKL